MNDLEKYLYPIPGSGKEAEIVIFTRKHWFSFFSQVLTSIFLVLIPLVFEIMMRLTSIHITNNMVSGLIAIGGGIYYLIIIAFIFTSWVSYYYDIYILTKDEIVDITQQGFFGRNVAQLSLMRVQDVSSHIEGFFPTLFSYGDVIIETAGERSDTFHIKSISNPNIFSAKVLEMHNQLIGGSGHKEGMMSGEGVVKPVPNTTPAPVQAPTVAPAPEQNQQIIEPQTNEAAAPTEPKEGEVSNDDLNKGGEVKF